jgi:lipoate-protein ligase A
MALDEAVLIEVGAGTSPPTLRLYDWSGPWVSLGSGQPAADLDRAALAEQGWSLLRRSSGGAAVLHRGQLGYALILPAAHPLWAGDLIASYQRLSVPLQRAFASLGIPADAAPKAANLAFVAGAPPLAARACFGALGPYELVHEGRKLLGNSQIRRRAAAVQHGVIQVSDGQGALAAVVARASAAERAALAAYLDTHAGSLIDCAGQPIIPEAVAAALAAAFAALPGVCLVPGALTAAERQLAAELVATKYGNPEWTFRR